MMKKESASSLSKSEIKHIRSLAQKKFRERHREFVIEGPKLVNEAHVSGAKLLAVYATEPLAVPDVRLIREQELAQLSSLRTPNQCVAKVAFPPPSTAQTIPEGWVLAAHELNDPGNLGTLIRIADWFGIRTLICSEHSVDCYNPKVVQASMGSLFRVQVHYVNLPEWLHTYRESGGGKVWVADMAGISARDVDWPQQGVLVLGSESHGVPEKLRSLADGIVSVPGSGTAESLNVAVSAGILVHEVFEAITPRSERK